MNYPESWKDFIRFKELEVSVYTGEAMRAEHKEYLALAKRYNYATIEECLK
jgi:hypothetical protein